MMQCNKPLDDLNRRFERLVLRRDVNIVLSEEKRREITKKYKLKTLQELNEIANNLPSVES